MHLLHCDVPVADCHYGFSLIVRSGRVRCHTSMLPVPPLKETVPIDVQLSETTSGALLEAMYDVPLKANCRERNVVVSENASTACPVHAYVGNVVVLQELLRGVCLHAKPTFRKEGSEVTTETESRVALEVILLE